MAASPLTKVLIANRGEIAVRIVRACQDAGIKSVAVYADGDRDALHVRLADEAFALGGSSATDTYLSIDKILDVASRAGADSVHPGYGFLAESSGFAQAVIDADLTWIGPPPQAIENLGDKVSARHIAQRAGAPLVAGTPGPVNSVDEVLTFADEHGLPIAIKAAFGGGGRGLKVARSRDEVAELYESAVREATASFGRGECFVERYLDSPRHVETQCLADEHGNAVVVSTRDCSLQRRHQKLVEEAPAPFLSDAQNEQLVSSSIAIMKEASYVGAGTCEFLVGLDGTISFLEVNTRLQVEHPVTEEISGIDLVREQFRIAAGEPLGYDSVSTRGHSFEFRLNGEDPAANFLPSPGTVSRLKLPTGPGVRVDTGVEDGDVVSGAFDSMLAKLIVTGATREEALARSRRALSELDIEGIATVVPFHRAVINEPDFTAEDGAFKAHTRWIETEYADRLGTLTAQLPAGAPEVEQEQETERVVVEVGGKRLEVVLPASLNLGARRTNGNGARKPSRRGGSRNNAASAASGNSLESPMQGTIVKIAVEAGDEVSAGDLVVVLEAMKMEQPLVAHRDGVVGDLMAEVGATVSAGTVICHISDKE